MPKFSIISNLSISPLNLAEEIRSAIQKYFDDRGDDESSEEYLNRKVEEYILGIYRQRMESEALAVAAETKRAEINADAQIRVRKDKPVVSEEDEKASEKI